MEINISHNRKSDKEREKRRERQTDKRNRKKKITTAPRKAKQKRKETRQTHGKQEQEKKDRRKMLRQVRLQKLPNIYTCGFAEGCGFDHNCFEICGRGYITTTFCSAFSALGILLTNCPLK